MLEVIAAKRDGYPFISGHRGAAGYAPENTMAAFRKGWELGADLLELDVQLTKDGHVVVVHDHTLDRTTNGKGWVHEHTLAQMKALDAGSWYGAAFAGEQIPTLDELAQWAKGRVRLNIEIKSTPHTIGNLPEQVVDICRNHGIVDETLIISFDHHAILRVKQKEPNLASAINYSAYLVDPVGAARAAKADILNGHWAFITKDLCDLAHANGLGVQCFMNDPERAKMLAAMGVDFMDADHPDKVKAAVRGL